MEITRASRMPPPRALLHCGSSAQLKRLKPLYLMLRSRAVYLVDFACFRTKPNCRVPFATFLEHSRVWPGFDERSVHFHDVAAGAVRARGGDVPVVRATLHPPVA